MIFEFSAQSLCSFHAWDHPERMAEYTSEFVVAIWIKAILIVFAKQIKELIYVFIVNKGAIVFGSEKLSEVEGLFVFNIVVHQIT